MPAALLPPRWALTPPFHPYLRANHEDIPKVFLRAITGCRSAGGIFSVALSVNRHNARLGRRPLQQLPWRYQARCPSPLGPKAAGTPLARFRCPDFPPAQPACANQASDHPAHPPSLIVSRFLQFQTAGSRLGASIPASLSFSTTGQNRNRKKAIISQSPQSKYRVSTESDTSERASIFHTV